MTDTNSFLFLIQDLNQQVEHFERLKNQQVEVSKRLEKKEETLSRLAEEASDTLEAVAGLLRNNVDLRDHIISLKEAFAELGKKSFGPTYFETDQTVEDTQNEDEIEEKVKQIEVPLEEAQIVNNQSEEQEVLLSVNFPEAHHVELALAPWNWTSKPMEKCEDAWKTRARIPSGNGVLFKFIVDGEWRCSTDYPIVKDNVFENNFIDCA